MRITGKMLIRELFSYLKARLCRLLGCEKKKEEQK